MSSSLGFGRNNHRLGTSSHAARSQPRSTKGRPPSSGFGGGRQSQGQMVMQRKLRQQTTRDQRTTDAQTEEILRDLRLLQGHQQASQQNLTNVQRAKEQKERQRLSLEQKLESSKYSNEEQRVQIERNRQLLSTSDRLLSAQRRAGTRSESDLKDFNKWLTKSLGGNRINNSNKRKIESLLIYLSSKAERLSLLKAKAKSKPQQLERLRDLAKHKHESLRRSLTEESNKARECSEEVSKIRSEISELERDLAATQNSEVSTRTSVQDLDNEIQDRKIKQSKVLDALRKGLQDCATVEAQNDAMDTEMQTRVDDVTQKTANLQARLAQLLKEEGYGGCSDQEGEAPFDATDGIAVIESTLREQQQALEKALTKKEELLESINRLKNKDSACQEKELSTRTKTAQVTNETKEAHEQQTERRNELEKHLHNLDEAKKELENLEKAFSDIKESSTKHLDQASERAKEHLGTIEKEKQEISSLSSKLQDMTASVESFRESWSQTKVANENKKAETNRMVEDARASFENVKIDLKELLALKETPLALEKETLYQQAEADKLKAAIETLIEDHPELAQVRLLPEQESDVSLSIDDEQGKECLQPILEVWSEEVKAARSRVEIARKAAIAAKVRLVEEAEKQRKLQEAEQQRLKAEQERKRKEKAEQEQQLQEAEKQRLKAEKQRKRQEAEERRLEAEKQRELEEAEQRRLEVEQKRKQREAVAEKRRLDVEQKRKQKEEASEKKRVEAEQKRKQEDEASEKRRLDVEQKRKQKEEASEKKRVEAEQKRKQRAEEKRKQRAEEKRKQKEEEDEQLKAERKGKGEDIELQKEKDKPRHKPRRSENKSKEEAAEEISESSSKHHRNSLDAGSKGSKRKSRNQVVDDSDEETDDDGAGDANFHTTKVEIDTSALSQATFTPKRRPSLRSNMSTGMHSQSSNKRVRWEDHQTDDEELSDPEDLAPPPQSQTKPARSAKSRLGNGRGDESSSRRVNVKSRKQSRDRMAHSSGSDDEGGVLGSTITTNSPKSRDPKASKLPVSTVKDPQKDDTSLAGVDPVTSNKRKSSSSSKKKKTDQSDSSRATDDVNQPVRSKDKSKRPSSASRLSKESLSKHSSRKSHSSSTLSQSSSSKKRRVSSSSDPLGRMMPKFVAKKPRRKGKKKDVSGVSTVSTKAFSNDVKFTFM